MPLYDTKCTICGHEEERLVKYDEAVRCGKCGAPSIRLVNQPNKVINFKPRWFEHFGPKPIFVESKKQLKMLCKEHECRSRYLEDA